MASCQPTETASSNTSDLKSYEYRDQFNHDTKELLIQAAVVKEAAKIMQKQQMEVRRKMTKKHSKQLPECIERYNTSLMNLQSALKEIGEIVTDGRFADKKQTKTNRQRSRTWNEPKREISRPTVLEETFSGQPTQCMHSFNKETEIQGDKKQLTRQRQESEEKTLNSINTVVSNKRSQRSGHLPTTDNEIPTRYNNIPENDALPTGGYDFPEMNNELSTNDEPPL